MRLYWTRSETIGSRVIAGALGEDCSHFVARADLPEKSLCFEARGDLDTVAELEVPELRRRYRIIHELVPREFDEGFERLFFAHLKMQVGVKYDYRAVGWWAVVLLGKRIFGTSMPRENRWGSRNAHLCVELLRNFTDLFDKRFGTRLDCVDLEMISPHGLFCVLQNSPGFLEVKNS